MAAFPISAVEVVRTLTDTSPFTLHFPDSGTTLKRGQPVSLNGSGQIITAAFGGAKTKILGFLAEDAPNVAGTLTKVWVANPSSIFVATLVASKTTTTYPQLVGSTANPVTTGTVMQISATSDANDQLIIVAVDSRAATSAGGDTNLPIHFTVLASQLVWAVGR